MLNTKILSETSVNFTVFTETGCSIYLNRSNSVETPITQTGFESMYTDTNTQTEECSKMLLGR